MMQMARAYYSEGDIFKPFTADMVGALAIDGSNQYIELTHNNPNETGYREVFSQEITDIWENCRACYLVRSRHSGTGILSIGFSCIGSLDAGWIWDLKLFGENCSGYEDTWTLVYSANHYLALYWFAKDYNETTISVLNNWNLPNPSNGWWTTNSPETMYGSSRILKASTIGDNVVVSSIQPTSLSAKLWIIP